jgi:hypothetical protein
MRNLLDAPGQMALAEMDTFSATINAGLESTRLNAGHLHTTGGVSARDVDPRFHGNERGDFADAALEGLGDFIAAVV